MSATRAVVLARGLGKRMRAPDPASALTEEQRRAADAGYKAMMPMHGRPFLDFVLGTLVEAGIGDVALVVAPDHEAVSRYYAEESPPSRLRLAFVVQQEPLGTANAVLAAEPWVSGEPFLTVNADNLYPVPVLAALAGLDGPGLAAFEAEDLVRSGNIATERLRSFAFIDIDAAGFLTRIVEKPSEGGLPPFPVPETVAVPLPQAAAETGTATVSTKLISMNCWRFDSRIFDACRDVPQSARGEFELPEAVGLAVRRGVRFRAVRGRGPVLDLSRRADAVDVARRLAGVNPRL